MIAPYLQQTDAGVRICLYVQPRASRNQVVGVQGDELKVRLTSPPVEGAANKLCCEFFAKLLVVAKGDVRLEAGERSRHKRLLIAGKDIAEVSRVLAGLGG